MRKSLDHSEKPKVFDLFAGAGGFSLGFHQAGFETLGMLEIDLWATDTLKNNFPSSDVLHQSIIDFNAEKYFQTLGQTPSIIIGGPPCQGFSLCRRGTGEPTDPRNELLFEFLKVVKAVQPDVFVIENVANLFKAKNKDKVFVRDVLREEIEGLGYNFYINVLDATHFGVPQMRKRCFIIGSKRILKTPYPIQTHIFTDQSDLLTNYKQTPSLWEAISDLPVLDAGQGAEVAQYDKEPLTDYQRMLRNSPYELYNHKAMRHSKRMVQRFEAMNWGQSGSDVPDHLKPRKRNSDKISSFVYDQNNRRLFPDRPSHTIPASFYANFVHPFQHRNFTAREGARIQSFPDDYQFLGKPTVVSTKLLQREGRNEELHLCQYNQVGNAVPPLLARAVAEHLKGEVYGGS